MSSEEKKAQVQSQFGKHAAAYVSSASHAKHSDLDRLIAIAQPEPDWCVLDIATGGGHTALKFAPYVKRVIAADLTFKMLQAAHENIIQQAKNVFYVQTDAEHLAFPEDTFDLVTCRIAPHHFPDVFRFMQECTRVLKPDGILLIQDHLLPDDEAAARYVDSFERLRDPSHFRAYADYEWRGLYLDAGLRILHTESLTKSHKLIPWAERQSCTPQTITQLEILLMQAPLTVRNWLKPICVGTVDAAFNNHHFIISGQKDTADGV